MEYQDQKKGILVLLSLIFHFTIIIFTTLPYFIIKEPEPFSISLFSNQDLFPLVLTFGIMAVIDPFIIIFFPLIINQFKTKKEKRTAEEIYHEQDSSLFKTIFLDFHNFTQQTHTTTLIRMALAESIVILGLVLSIITKNPFYVIPFAGLGLTLQIIFGPIIGMLICKK